MRIAVLASVLALLAQPCSAKQNLYLIALMGQSNMVGAGEVSELPAGFPAHPSKLWNFTNAYRWEPAREPVDSARGQRDAVSLDKSAGVGPSLALADAFVSRHPGISVGLIPCAKSGSSISQWQEKISRPEDSLFDSCMHRMKTVSPAVGAIRAVVFWQGGRDARRQEDAMKWADRFTTFVDELRKGLGNPNLPIIMVVLGDKDERVANKYPYWNLVREQQRSVNIPGVFKIEANGYEREDGIHFTTKGQLAFGAAIAGLLPAP